MFSSPHHLRSGIRITNTMPKPQNTAPITKYNGKIVACQPAIWAVQKSKPTMELTVNTRSVQSPESTM